MNIFAREFLLFAQAASAAQPDSSGGLAASSSSSSSSSSARSALQLLRGAAVLCSELLAWQHGALDPWATPGGEAMSLKLPVDCRDAIVSTCIIMVYPSLYFSPRGKP